MTSIITRPFGSPPPIPGSEQPVIPGSGDNTFRPMTLVRPFIDPVNTFRAQVVEDMFFIVPERRDFSQFEFDVGLDPLIEPFIFSIQNKTVNADLRVKLTLPSYLRSDLGTEFLVPAIGNTETPPVFFLSPAEREALRQKRLTPGRRALIERGLADDPRLDPRIIELINSGRLADPADVGIPEFVGSGKGLVNVTITFSEEQVKTFNPGNIVDDIVFDIFPNDKLTGPVFVSTVVTPPKNLNIEEGKFPIDDDQPMGTGSLEPEVVTITETVEVPVEVPVPTPAFIAGADGITEEGVSFNAGDTVPGAPPAGWTTEADGRAYPPIEAVLECDPTGDPGDGTGDGTGTGITPPLELTPLQQLVKDAERIPPSFGAATRRRGFVVNALAQLTGNQPGRVSRRTVELIVADSVPGQTQFAIVGRSSKFIDGTSVTSDQSTREYFDTVNLMVGLVKEGQTVPFSLRNVRNFALSRGIKDRFERNERLSIPETLSTAELQNVRIGSTALSLLEELRRNGAGSSPGSSSGGGGRGAFGGAGRDVDERNQRANTQDVIINNIGPQRFNVQTVLIRFPVVSSAFEAGLLLNRPTPIVVRENLENAEAERLASQLRAAGAAVELKDI